MSAFDSTRLAIALAIIVVIVILFFKRIFYKKTNSINAKFITRTAIFAAISIVLYVVPYLKFSVPFFPAFLELHFDEVPIFIAGFAYGPLSAFFIILIKTIVKLPMTTSLCVGEFTDLLYGIVFVVPAAWLYQKKRTFKGMLSSIGISTLLQIVVASFFTTFVILDFYSNVMGISKSSILAMCQSINPNITSLDWPFLLIVALPFNLFKDGLVVAITILLYKRIHRLIDKIGQEKN